jgi:DNA-binding transcriptional MerR regulator
MRRLTPGKLTLGQLARASGLARASLLHYEALGLLLPAGRSSAGYRLYGDAELARLQNIRRLRAAGLSLDEIASLLQPKAAMVDADNAPAAILESRLLGLCAEVERLRSQQQQLARLLAAARSRAGKGCRDKAAWVALLRRAGFDEADMRQWHSDFEADSPDEHAAFLRSLGLAEAEVVEIRAWSQANRAAGG